MPKPLCLWIAFALQGGAFAAQEDKPALRFSSDLFRDATGQPVDVSKFAHGNPVTPGQYDADLYANGTLVARQTFDIGVDADGHPTVCLSQALLTRIGVDATLLPEASRANAHAEADACSNPVERVPGAKVKFDFSELRIDLDLPQAYLRRHPRGYVDPRFWDEGVTAGVLGYDANVYRNWSNGRTDTEAFVGLDAGLNVRGWQLRHQGNLTARVDGVGGGDGVRQRYAALNTYARHDVTSLRAQFVAGQSYTPGDLFEGMGFTGVQLTSDERMLPDSQRSFAPVVRGVASTNARVTIRQGNSVVYETTVPPGPFVIDDLYDTGYAGDLTVTVAEADGRSHSFLLPYASIPQLLRPGTHRFSATAGVLRDPVLTTHRPFFQGTYRKGISNTLTLYGGITASLQYQSAVGGAAILTPIGAIAADVSQSWSQGIRARQGERAPKGQSYRLTYSHRMPVTDTSFTLGAYRYSSRGYLTFAESERARAFDQPPPQTIRQRLQLNLSQPLPGNQSTVYFNGYLSSYWGQSGSEASFSAGYTRNFSFGSVGLNIQRSRTQNGRFDNQVLLSLTLPLGRLPRTPVAQARVGYNGPGRIDSQLSVAGTGNNTGTLSYNVFANQTRTDGRNTVSGGGGIGYVAPAATINVAGSAGEHFSQLSAAVQGSVVAHPGGITLAQRNSGEAMAVVEAPGAEGASVLGGPGVRVNRAGYAVVPTLSPYRLNEIGINADSTRVDVDILGSATMVAPRSGAVVMVKFRTERGQAAMLRIVRDDGKPVPIGADVRNADGKSIAVVGQGGLVFLRSTPGMQVFTVTWGKGGAQQCKIRHRVPEASTEKQPTRAERVACHAADAPFQFSQTPDTTIGAHASGSIHQ